MKKYVLIIALMIGIVSLANAQEDYSNKSYVGYSKTSAFIQYGWGPINTIHSWSDNIFKSRAWLSDVEIDKMTNIGAISAGINIDFSKLLELSVPFTYSRSTGDLRRKDGAPIPIGGTEFHEDWYSLTPSLKINWYRAKTEKLTLYSRVGIGICLACRCEGYDYNGMNSKIAFAFQASPIGIEIGKNTAFFAEAGFGQLGYISAGVRFRFRKSKVEYNNDGTPKKFNWYDRYMDKK